MPDKRPPGWSVYGRIDRAIVACPVCGGLVRADNRPGYSQAIHAPVPNATNHVPREQIYRWRSARLTCPWCRTTYGLGLVLWRVQHGGDRFLMGTTPPEDQADPVYLAHERAESRPVFAKQADPEPDSLQPEGLLDPKHYRPAGYGRTVDQGAPLPAIAASQDDNGGPGQGKVPDRPTGELGGWYVPDVRLAPADAVNLDLGACSCGEHLFSDPRCPVHGWE